MRYVVVLTVAALIGCTGHTLGENRPGADTYLGDARPYQLYEDLATDARGIAHRAPCLYNGSIAVDHRNERIFVLQNEIEERCGDWSWQSEPARMIYALNPDGGPPEMVADMTDRSDIRMLFPGDKVLVMYQEGDYDRLLFLDAATLDRLDLVRTSSRYHGTRLSASRRFIGVAANEQRYAPIHIIDSDTNEILAVPHGGEWLEAMWLNRSDRFVAIVFDDIETDHPEARLVAWTLDAEGTPDELDVAPDGMWAERDLDITVPGAKPDSLFSYTWVAIAPDDSYAVVPVVLRQRHTLLVVDLDRGELRTVDDARGPVGFAPDGSTIVAYRYLPDANDGHRPALVLVDADTLAERVVPVDLDSGGPHYFVTREGNFVVLAASGGNDGLILYDVDNDRSTPLGGSDMSLNEFVSRIGSRELWVLSTGRLFRLHLDSGELEHVPLAFAPAHINILVDRDRLVLDDPGSSRLLLFDPVTQSVDRVLLIPNASLPAI